jgi:hypothetical protein
MEAVAGIVRAAHRGATAGQQRFGGAEWPSRYRLNARRRSFCQAGISIFRSSKRALSSGLNNCSVLCSDYLLLIANHQ